MTLRFTRRRPLEFAFLASSLVIACRRTERAAPAPPPPVFRSESESYVALQRDFATYQRWERVAEGSGRIPGHPEGTWVLYRNRPPPPGARSYPRGTILVKE